MLATICAIAAPGALIGQQANSASSRVRTGRGSGRWLMSAGVGALLWCGGQACAQVETAAAPNAPPSVATGGAHGQAGQPSTGGSQTGSASAAAAQRASATSQNTQAASATTVGDLIITAQSRAQTLQNTPIAVSAYTDERRNLVGIETASDFVNFTPSMSLTGDFLSIRGVGRVTDTLGTDPGVAIFVDGIYQPSPSYLNQPDFFTDSIDIERGPQGVLGGLNAIGGTVDVTEKRPTDTFHEEVRAGVNDYKYNYYEASISGPITHTLSFRLAGDYADQPSDDGYFKNLDSKIYPGSGYYGEVEAQLEWKPTSNFDAWFKVAAYPSAITSPCEACTNGNIGGFQRQEYTPYPPQAPGINNLFGVPGNCIVLNGANACLAGSPAAVRSALLGPASNPAIQNGNVLDYNTVGYVDLDDDWSFTANLTYTLPWASIEYIGGYTTYDYKYESDYDGTPSSPAIGNLPAGYIDETEFGYQAEQNYQNEIRLKSNNDQRLQWLVGFFQLYNAYQAPYNISEPNNTSLSTPDTTTTSGVPGAPNPSRDIYYQNSNLVDHDEAIYGNVDYKLSDTVRLTGGLRYNWDSEHGTEQLNEIFDTYGVFLGYFGTPGYVENSYATQSVHSQDWTGKLSAQWNVNPSTMLYGTLTKGYKSAGMSLGGLIPIPTVAPETLYDYEAGVKATIDNQLLVNADIYYYDYHNLQTLVPAVLTGNVIGTTLDSAERARSYGFELESVWSPTQNFQLTFNYSYLNARFTNFSGPIEDYAQQAPGCVGTGSAATPCTGVIHANLNGNVLPQSPENKVTVNPVYTLPTPLGKFTFSATYAYVGSQYYAVFTTPFYEAPAYSDVDLRLLYQPPQGRYTFILYARNVTNSLQITQLQTGQFYYGPSNLVRGAQSYPSAGTTQYFVNPPRVIGVEFQARF